MKIIHQPRWQVTIAISFSSHKPTSLTCAFQTLPPTPSPSPNPLCTSTFQRLSAHPASVLSLSPSLFQTLPLFPFSSGWNWVLQGEASIVTKGNPNNRRNINSVKRWPLANWAWEYVPHNTMQAAVYPILTFSFFQEKVTYISTVKQGAQTHKTLIITQDCSTWLRGEGEANSPYWLSQEGRWPND